MPPLTASIVIRPNPLMEFFGQVGVPIVIHRKDGDAGLDRHDAVRPRLSNKAHHVVLAKGDPGVTITSCDSRICRGPYCVTHVPPELDRLQVDRSNR
jgi:hypothetical protein